ncbi:MAG: BrnT family toxin [Pseudomonadota bacterium]|nr:BrnT family toxin [Pseudomonadota bacterium]
MLITFDRAKREKTLATRGLDFKRAKEVFNGLHLTRSDDRHDYSEERFVSAGRLEGRIVIIVWTPRGRARRVISMRKANKREIKKLSPQLA